MNAPNAQLSKRKELIKRILFTVAMLAVFRIGTQVTVPGVDTVALSSFFESTANNALGLFNRFTGGALENFSIFSLGVMPYITSSIIFSLLAMSFPYFAEMQKENDGRKKIAQWTRYGAVLLCIFQGYGLSLVMENSKGLTGSSVVLDAGWDFRLMSIVSLTAGSMFVMWLGERITERGIGNGVSLIIFAGIASGIPAGMSSTITLYRNGELPILSILAILATIVATFWFIIFVERAFRKVVVHYAKRVVNNRVYGGQSSHLPIKVNVSGIMPPIFASAILTVPNTLFQYNFLNLIPDNFIVLKLILESIKDALMPGNTLYNLVFVIFIIFFSFFYSSMQFKAKDISEMLQKNGGFIPGVRPGNRTEEFLRHIVDRLALVGGLYVAAICLLPAILLLFFNIPFYFGGTSLLILVGVAIDTLAQAESYMISDRYDQLYKVKGKFSGPKRF